MQRLLKHYSLPAILAIGYRVRSPRGTQFRQWVTTRLTELLQKGFTLDDERLKNPASPGSPDCFSELLARIRDIRSSERVFYKKVLEIYATSIDYDPRAEASLANADADEQRHGPPRTRALDATRSWPPRRLPYRESPLSSRTCPSATPPRWPSPSPSS